MVKPIIVYVVSGTVRSGTSMMMESLINGGMVAAYTKKTGMLAKEVDGYIPNKKYFELSLKERRQKGFPAMYGGMLIKLLLHRIDEIYNMPANVIFKTIMMRRDRSEIVESANRARIHIGKEDNPEYIEETIIEAESHIPWIKEHSIRYKEVWYPDVIGSALDIFTELKYDGWPIDPEKCAEIPNVKLYRSKGELK